MNEYYCRELYCRFPKNMGLDHQKSIQRIKHYSQTQASSVCLQVILSLPGTAALSSCEKQLTGVSKWACRKAAQAICFGCKPIIYQDICLELIPWVLGVSWAEIWDPPSFLPSQLHSFSWTEASQPNWQNESISIVYQMLFGTHTRLPPIHSNIPGDRSFQEALNRGVGKVRRV